MTGIQDRAWMNFPSSAASWVSLRGILSRGAGSSEVEDGERRTNGREWRG